jgi:hypothetical protein
MAIEYSLASEADVDTQDLQDFMVAAIGGEKGPDGTVFRDGMYVMAHRLAEGEENSAMQLFGIQHRVSATFRLANLADEATRNHNTALMVGAVLAFFHRYAGRGVLLFNGEVAILQRLTGEIVFDREWEDWFENDEVTPLLDGYPIRPLPQPLL